MCRVEWTSLSRTESILNYFERSIRKVVKGVVPYLLQPILVGSDAVLNRVRMLCHIWISDRLILSNPARQCINYLLFSHKLVMFIILYAGNTFMYAYVHYWTKAYDDINGT